MHNGLDENLAGVCLSGLSHELSVKFRALVSLVKSYGKAAVAFSGGVDSAFLAKVCHDSLGGNALAITVDSEAYPPETITDTRELARLIGIKLIEIKVSACSIPEFSANEPERCYSCKKALFSLMREAARAQGIPVLIDGSNRDDRKDYRPGMRALSEMDIKSPLDETGFTKEEIRMVSRELGLPTWNRQSFACLASRFPYGTRITPELLERTWKAEAVLKGLGFARYRVRNHGDLARIELDPADMAAILSHEDYRERIVSRLKSLGFTYITLDLAGYRTGSMNETLTHEK
jgi:pyridinium-3,5-biscarboxylic acid mononucleotide sulfurtransferase